MAIRIATQEDIPQILSIYAPYITQTTISFEYTVPSLKAFTKRFNTITKQFPWLVWVENDKVLGYAYGSAPFERAAANLRSSTNCTSAVSTISNFANMVFLLC